MRSARPAFAVNAVVAWGGVVLTLVLSTLGAYGNADPEPGLYGGHAAGMAGALPRLVDSLSYFTIWSNIVVAVSVTMLLARPLEATPLRRTLRLAGLTMITVTAIIYYLLLFPGSTIEGWSLLTDPWLHAVTPALTVVVFAVWGPYGWFGLRTALASLLVPLAWLAYMLVRGALVGDYPYGIVNVTEYGYPAVLRTLAMILVFGLVVALVFTGIDRVRGRSRAAV